VIALTTGLLTGLSLIIAIGAQNAYILRLGLSRQHVFIAALFCSLSDALLIVLGIAGLGALIQSLPILLEIFRYAGAAYLTWFGISAVRRVFKTETLESQGQNGSLKKTLLTLAAITFLNPHVYLDTVILLGSIGNQFGDDRWLFAVGGATGSFMWFFGLSYGAKLLAKYVAKPIFWKILDSVIALVMFAIAGSLLFAL
jgi:L-lysine exporter family protein LysE/ArgO